MSTLTVTNIQATGETASRAVSGVAATWTRFNGTGTAAISDSINISSISDLGTGDYRLNMTNSFASTNAAAGAGQYDDASGTTPTYASTSSVINVQFFSSGSAADAANLSSMTFGDLA